MRVRHALTIIKFGFLENLVKVFPSLKTRPLYLTGESYAGTYIVSISEEGETLVELIFSQPYITKTYFGLKNPPVKLAKIAIGDGTIGSGWEFEILPTVRLVRSRSTTFPRASPSFMSLRPIHNSSAMTTKSSSTSRNSEWHGERVLTVTDDVLPDLTCAGSI